MHNAASHQGQRRLNIKMARQRTIAVREHRTIRLGDHTQRARRRVEQRLQSVAGRTDRIAAKLGAADSRQRNLTPSFQMLQGDSSGLTTFYGSLRLKHKREVSKQFPMMVNGLPALGVPGLPEGSTAHKPLSPAQQTLQDR
jgi:hypothetical protein